MKIQLTLLTLIALLCVGCTGCTSNRAGESPAFKPATFSDPEISPYVNGQPSPPPVYQERLEPVAPPAASYPSYTGAPVAVEAPKKPAPVVTKPVQRVSKATPPKKKTTRTT